MKNSFGTEKMAAKKSRVTSSQPSMAKEATSSCGLSKRRSLRLLVTKTPWRESQPGR